MNLAALLWVLRFASSVHAHVTASNMEDFERRLRGGAWAARQVSSGLAR